jgi:outer membrane autotransporter protein
VEQDFHFFDASVALNGDQVDLTVTPDPDASYSSAAATLNQLAVGTVLDAQGDGSDLDSVLRALYSLPTSELQQALDEIGGEALTAFTTAQLANGQKFTRTVTSRLGLVGGRAIGSPGTVDLVASLRATQQGPTQGLSSWAPVQLAMAGGLDSARMLQLAAAGPAVSSPLPDERRRVGLWLDGYGLLGGVDGDGNTAKTKWTVPGVVGGLDVALGRRWVLGLAAGWARLDLDVKHRSMNGEADVFQGGLYGAYVGERLYVGGLARYAYTSYDTSRHVVFGSGVDVIDRTLTADYKGNDLGGYLEAGYVAWAPAGFQIEPMAAFDYTWLQRESFVESGADDIALAVDKATWHSLLGSVGLRVHKSIALQEDEALRMVPELSARYAHQFGDRDRPLDARIVGADPGTGNFQVVGASASSYGAILGLGWSVVREDNLAFFVQYDLNWNRDLLGHALALGLLVRF